MDKKIAIYYDGSCDVCSTGIGKVCDSSQGEKFEKRDITKSALPNGVPFEKAWREMYVVDSEGKMYAGTNAALRILEEYPRWRWLARFGRWPVINQLVSLGYRIVAANRHRFDWRRRPNS